MIKTIAELSKLPFFRISHFEVIFPLIKRDSLYQKISRYIKKGEIIKLKKGFYVAKEYREKHISDPLYFYYLANILRYPSYVSGAYILQNYDILTEAIYPITSITVKTTRRYSNKFGSFIYYSMSPKLYIGYKRLFYKGEPVYAACMAKALFDYLYIKYFKSKLAPEEIKSRERLNLEKFTKKDIKEFKEYCRLSGRKLLIDISVKIFSN